MVNSCVICLRFNSLAFHGIESISDKNFSINSLKPIYSWKLTFPKKKSKANGYLYVRKISQ